MKREEENLPHSNAEDNQKLSKVDVMEITSESLKEEQRPNKNSLVYKFEQQLISAWRPVASLSSSIVLFFVLSKNAFTQLPSSPSWEF